MAVEAFKPRGYGTSLECSVSIQSDGDRPNIEVHGHGHPFAQAVVTELNEASPDELPALDHLDEIVPPDVMDFGLSLWSEYAPRPITVSILRQPDHTTLTIRREFFLSEDPCPFLEDDHEEWSLLLDNLSHSLTTEHPLFRELRILRWSGIYASDISSGSDESIRFQRPSDERREHELLVTPWQEDEWTRIRSLFVRPLETQLARYASTGPLLEAEEHSEFF